MMEALITMRGATPQWLLEREGCQSSERRAAPIAKYRKDKKNKIGRAGSLGESWLRLY